MKSKELAINGGRPVRAGEPIPLSRVDWGEREQAAVLRVFESGVFCSVYPEANEVKALESEFAREVGARHAVAFSSCTTAQHAALVALGVGPGDQVIVPPLTFISTAYTVLIAGAVPVFADVCRDTITIDPHDVRQKITPYTKAIVPVHWFGHPADMEVIVPLAAEHDLYIVEDCAHGPGIKLHGRQAGRFGQIACWSLQQTKLLTAAGEGGLATTDDDDLAARLRQVRDHGKAPAGSAFSEPEFSYSVSALGNNYRLGELHAAFARAQLSRFSELRERRRDAYAFLQDRLRDVPGLEFQALRPGAERSYVSFPVLFPRESFCEPASRINRALHAEGVLAYPIALDELCHVHPLFAKPEGRATAHAFQLGGAMPLPVYGWGTLLAAEKIAHELLILPLHPALSRQDLDDIVAAVDKVASAFHC